MNTAADPRSEDTAHVGLSGPARHGDGPGRDELAARLHRIQGQLRGIERMVEEERCCVDVLTQISAAASALESLGFELLEAHVDGVVARALAMGDRGAAQELSRDLVEVIERFALRQ